MTIDRHLNVRLRHNPDAEVLTVYAVEPPTPSDPTWRVMYGQAGPPPVIAATFDTEDEAWAHAEMQCFPRPT